MEPIDTEILEHSGSRFRIRLYPDPDAPNPLDEWSEMGTILSLNRRHRNFDPDAIEAAVTGNPDAVPLSYYEHGLCLWRVAGELPASATCPFDSVAFAGLWLPDAETLASARFYGGRTRRHFMRKHAREACDVYTQWCNGEVYGFEIEHLTACAACGEEQAEPVESVWGFYGLEECRDEARAMAEACGRRRAA